MRRLNEQKKAEKGAELVDNQSKDEKANSDPKPKTNLNAKPDSDNDTVWEDPEEERRAAKKKAEEERLAASRESPARERACCG